MTDQQQIQWDLDFDELKSASLLDALVIADTRAQRFIVMDAQDWGRCMIRVMAEAQRLTALAAAQQVIAGGQAPEDFSLNQVIDIVQPKVGDREQWALAEKLGTLEWMKLAEWSVTAVLRDARFTKKDEKGLTRYHEPQPEQMQGLAVPMTLLGIAALAAAAYYGSEHSADTAAVEVEKAWAMAKAYSEIKIAEAQILAGQKPTLSDWAAARAGKWGIATVTTTSWFPYAAGLGGLALIGGAVYLGRAKTTRNPGPRPPTGYRSMIANPKRRRRSRSNPCAAENPSRAEFIREAKRSGASDKQAARLWRGYLASQRSKAGRRGGKARSRRRRNAAPAMSATPAPRAPRGSARSPKTSTKPKRSAPAPAKPPASRSRATSAPKPSPKRARNARRAAPKSAPKRRGSAK